MHSKRVLLSGYWYLALQFDLVGSRMHYGN